MRFQPKTEEEVLSVGVLEGIFDFEITAAREYVSDKGNETFELQLTVFDTEGKPLSKKDWVTPAFAKKFKHIHDSCGMIDKYQAGITVADDFIGKSGKLKMAKRKYTNKDGVEMIGDQVEDYIKRENMIKETVATGALPIDDVIPF